MAFVPLRTDSDRYVLFLRSPLEEYQRQLEGRERQRTDAQIRKFLTESTPDSALEDERKFTTPLRQLKDRGGKVRALGVWCQGEVYDLFIIQTLFNKDDEDRVYAKTGGFASNGRDLRERFDGRDYDFICQKADEWREADHVKLVTPPGVP